LRDPNEVSWDEAALVRLERIPGFIRKMVKKKAEAYVLDNSESIVRVRHLEELTARRFGSNRQKKPKLFARTTD
jgi:hypothetical protein